MADCHVRRFRKASRHGTTMVEVAVVLPVFLIFIFGLWAYGHAQMTSNMLKGAVRQAARYGATDGVTSAQVEAKVRQIMGTAIDPSKVTIEVKNAASYDGGGSFPSSPGAINALPNIELKSASSRQLFVVRASVAYNDVGVVPNKWFKNLTLYGQSFMRHE
jgi:Flp pilus assembly protein TadG